MSDYDTWHQVHMKESDIETSWHDFVKFQLRLIELQSKVVLEIGCGRGGFSNYIVGQYPDLNKLYACDFSDSALEMGRSRYPSNRIMWQKEDIQQLSFEDGAFDAVISCETIEHIPRPLKALSELYRVLKPGGLLILTCPNYLNLFGIWCLYRKLIGKPFTEGGQPFVNYLFVTRIYRYLKRLGFRITHYHSAELIFPARVPKTLYPEQTPRWLKYLGSRTYYTAIK